MALNQPVVAKPAIASKINWLGLITIGGSIASYVATQINAKAAVGGIIVGALAILLRTFGTTQPISGIFNTP